MQTENVGGGHEDFEAARALLAENILLQQDPYAQRVLVSGVADNGKPIEDMESFLRTREAILEKRRAELKLEKLAGKKGYDAAVTFGVDPAQESAWEN